MNYEKMEYIKKYKKCHTDYLMEKLDSLNDTIGILKCMKAYSSVAKVSVEKRAILTVLENRL